MSSKTRGRIHLIYGIALSALILAVGVCFALSCISIYQSGASPYTKESISVHLYFGVKCYIRFFSEQSSELGQRKFLQ